jgi:hypothetical protein
MPWFSTRQSGSLACNTAQNVSSAGNAQPNVKEQP